MSDPIMDALSSSGDFAPIFKFANSGDTITGIIIDEPVKLPMTAYGTNEPKIGADGRPVMQVRLVVASEQHQDADHDGRWRIFIDKPLMREAVAQAVRATGAPTLQCGGEITLTFTGYRVLGSGQAKDFTAKYEPPSDADGPLGIGELGDTDDAPWGER